MNITTNITMTSGDYVPAEAPQRKPLQLEYGKHYRTRDGQVVGPLEVNKATFSETHPFLFDKWCWQPDGRFARVECPHTEWNLDLIEEVVVEPERNMAGSGYRLLSEDEFVLLTAVRSRVVELENLAAELREEKDALERSRDTWKAALAPYGNLVTSLAETLGMPTHEIPLDEVLANVKGLVSNVRELESAVARQNTRIVEQNEKLDSLQSNSKLAKLYHEAQASCNAWQETAAQHLRNEQFYRDLLSQCAKLLGDECRRCDDGRLIPADDFLALKVPEVLEKELRAGADIARENDELHRRVIADRDKLESLTSLANSHISLGHALFGVSGTFGNALMLGQDVVLDGMKWMRDEILRLREADSTKPFIRKLVATELGKATNNILKEL